jgi:hypothetical protein
MNIKTTLSIFVFCGAAGVATAEELNEKHWQTPNNDVTLRSGQPDLKDSGPPPAFSSLDSNGDGVIDVNESRGYPILYIDYEFADHNRDKRVSQREYAHWVQHGEDPAARR